MKKFIFLFVLFNTTAQSYPNFIHMGYSSCASCHYNPMGNGPLTDYGRTVSASGIAARDFWDKKASDEEVADKSALFERFLGADQPIPWLRMGLNIRTLYLKREKVSGLRFMDFSLDAVLKHSPAFWTSIKLDPENILGREYYAAYKISKAVGVYAGFMDKAFGLRVPDHIAYSRTFTENSYEDQSHGVMVHYLSKPIEFAVHSLFGNLKDPSYFRKQGASFTGEYEPIPRLRVGASIMQTKNQFTNLLALAPHIRIGWDHQASILLEAGSVKIMEEKKTYLFSQMHYLLRTGLFALISLEQARPNIAAKTKLYRITPGLQYFPNHGIEFRSEAAYKIVDTGLFLVRQTDLMLQTHFYF